MLSFRDLPAVLRQRVSLVWLAACVGALVPVLLGVLHRLAYALGQEALGRRLFGLIVSCFWVPAALVLPNLEPSLRLSPAQLLLAAVAVDSVLAAVAFMFVRSIFRIARRLLAARRARQVG